jgi:NTP pyrophosphatase (non-canonical NTP hydrolase)
MNRAEHLLSCLAEECAEVAQRATKAQRFGVLEVQPEQDENNWERLVAEYNDLVAVLGMLATETGLAARIDPALVQAKRAKVAKYMAYAESQGALTVRAGVER